MTLSALRELPPGLTAAVRALLLEAFKDTFSEEDWQHCLGGWHVLLHDAGVLVAHGAVVPRELHVGGSPLRAGYVEGVAAVPRGRGFGTSVMAGASAIVRREFDVGALSTGAHGFYEQLGWERWQGPTFVRDGADVVRTPDEDDGVMVLRFGESSALSLTQPISCETRAGDAW